MRYVIVRRRADCALRARHCQAQTPLRFQADPPKRRCAYLRRPPNVMHGQTTELRNRLWPAELTTLDNIAGNECAQLKIIQNPALLFHAVHSCEHRQFTGQETAAPFCCGNTQIHIHIHHAFSFQHRVVPRASHSQLPLSAQLQRWSQPMGTSARINLNQLSSNKMVVGWNQTRRRRGHCFVLSPLQPPATRHLDDSAICINNHTRPRRSLWSSRVHIRAGAAFRQKPRPQRV